MKLKELCADERPREKMMEKGAEALSNAELIAILLRTGTGGMNAVETARALLKDNDGRLGQIASLSIETLCRTKGIGPGKAVAVAAAFEIGKRHFAEAGGQGKVRISSPKDVFRILQPHLKDIEREECWILFLNKANILIGKERLSSGGMDSTVIDNRMIIRKAIEKKATGIIMAHNHPSGNAQPSPADIDRTRLLQKALKTCDISLVDHVITGSDSYYSFSDEELTENSISGR